MRISWITIGLAAWWAIVTSAVMVVEPRPWSKAAVGFLCIFALSVLGFLTLGLYGRWVENNLDARLGVSVWKRRGLADLSGIAALARTKLNELQQAIQDEERTNRGLTHYPREKAYHSRVIRRLERNQRRLLDGCRLYSLPVNDI